MEILSKEELVYLATKPEYKNPGKLTAVVKALALRVNSKTLGLRPLDAQVLHQLNIETLAQLLRTDDSFLVENLEEDLMSRVGEKLVEHDLFWGLLNSNQVKA